MARSVAAALAEDLGAGDLTAGLIPANRAATATVITREAAILCGRAWFDAVFAQLDPTVRIDWSASDGDLLEPGALCCKVIGPARTLLSGERVALNFLQMLSGTATLTRKYVDAVKGTGCRILDTRKTVPGLRLAQKYAVRCGGGTNHRIGLYDGILIKENHIAAAGSIAAAVAQAREVASRVEGPVLLEVEVENMDQLREALATGVRRILLDNFDRAQLRAAVGLVRTTTRAGAVELEASGNVTLTHIRSVAETGVDFISIGSLTKHVTAIDLSMRFEAD